LGGGEEIRQLEGDYEDSFEGIDGSIEEGKAEF
jgi:hypothetical protein